ncbi:MAG: prepilin-type N-terminal cleavage/methylation domain-containing protein [Candidatus Kerfeldbacteria bacterium]|nr:prepilin-type N-terminal cleavage/methylation domain-containing protein [Candidatus Kerfeldbacteria bacterium]
MRTKRNGFTVIELMIYVVIAGILAAIAIPNFIALQNRAKDKITRSNMHMVQLACEHYAIQNDGVYSCRAEDIVPFVPPSLKNPWNGKSAEVVFLGHAPADRPFGKGTLIVHPRTVNGVDTGGYVVRGVGFDGTLMSLQLTDAGPDTTHSDYYRDFSG